MPTPPDTRHTSVVDVDLDHGLLGILPQLSPSGVWIREGEGMIGLGVAASATAAGPQRFAELAAFWEAWIGTLNVGAENGDSDATAEDDPVAFLSVTFAADSQYASRLIVPEVLIRHQAGRATVLCITERHEPGEQVLRRHGLRMDHHGLLTTIGPPVGRTVPNTSLLPGAQSERQYLDGVTAGLSAIHDGTVEKLVLARDVLVSASAPVPTGVLLARLAAEYPQTWTYGVAAVPGAPQALVGATPEMLVRLRGDQLSSRVLAGTIDRAERTSVLVQDAKQHREHGLAVASLLDQLSTVTATLQAPDEPSVLQLPNVYHLASDITGTLCPDSTGQLPSPLRIAEAAHPTAAVCGTPTTAAAELIAQLEGMDRGPYAGPVGWIDTRGNADFGIALRGGVLEDPRTLRLFAGCGVVEGSEPEAELAETRVKLTPMLEALGLEQFR
ncbi:isochorismate synthase [Nesterenkonia muleiensis]|uniref:isochorismate synthase n=1 Tax=Nesterenkonia muleiensis TaxID=2282648 RepID=UPI000E74AA7B|nr:isochorismate synthase [Nesterenkonia muleiensis]